MISRSRSGGGEGKLEVEWSQWALVYRVDRLHYSVVVLLQLYPMDTNYKKLLMQSN